MPEKDSSKPQAYLYLEKTLMHQKMKMKIKTFNRSKLVKFNSMKIPKLMMKKIPTMMTSLKV